MADIWIQQDEDKTYMIRLRNDSWRMIMNSEGYKTKKACVEAVEIIRKSALDDANFEKKTDANGYHYFVLKTPDEKHKTSSCVYFSPQELEAGILDTKHSLANGIISYI